jgi:hypothetical protein
MRSADVRFSNRPVGVKHFQTIRHGSVDVAHGLSLLFGIGPRALVWGFFCQEVRQCNACLPSSVSLFDLKAGFFVPTRSRARAAARRGLSRLAGAPTFRYASLLRGHTLTASSTTAPLGAVGMTIGGGARFRARINRATTLYSVGPRTRTMMQSCASAAKLRAADPFFHSA